MTEFSTGLPCPLFAHCSGCSLQEEAATPPSYKEAADFFSPLPLPLFRGKMEGWRMRAKLAVRGTLRNPEIGLFRAGTHDVLEIPRCPMHHSEINRTVQEFKRLMVEYRIFPYCEQGHTGTVRYLQVHFSRQTGGVQAAVVCNAERLPGELAPLLDAFSVESLWVNFQPERSNRIFGSEWLHYSGCRYLAEELAGIPCRFHPASFAQAHTELFEKMLYSIRNKLLPGRRVVEFFGGIGVIGLAVAEKSSSLLCTEINPIAEECFLLSKELLYPNQIVREKVAFRSGAAETLLATLGEAEVVIVDPPRKGLDSAFLEALFAAPDVEQVFYVSCYFPSFKRDCKRFLEAGWILESAESYLLFPGTDQVEILAVFLPPTLRV